MKQVLKTFLISAAAPLSGCWRQTRKHQAPSVVNLENLRVYRTEAERRSS